jgi:hypothetical protein
MQLSLIENGGITGAWIYRPVQDEMFRRLEGGRSEHVTFDKETGRESVRQLVLPSGKALKDMRVVYPHAHPNVPLDDVTAPLYANEKGERLTHTEIVARLGNRFKKIIPADGYSFYHGELFLHNVDAVCVPRTYPWDHFAQAYIAMGVGYRVGFIDGQDYLNENGSIPLAAGPYGYSLVKHTGGVLYAHPETWDELNWELNINRHPLREKVLTRFHQNTVHRLI